MPTKKNPSPLDNPNNPRSIFYWNDWAYDPKLTLCSFAAQGLWMRLLCLAVKCEPYGHLAVDRRAMTHEELAGLLARPVAELSPLLQELEDRGVYSRDKLGRIYSRRLVFDQRRRAVARKNGLKGGNPNLRIGLESSGEDNPQLKFTDNPNTTSTANSNSRTPQTPHSKRYPKNDSFMDAEESQWRARLRYYFESGTWLSQWGDTPAQQRCRAPKHLIEEARVYDPLYKKD